MNILTRLKRLGFRARPLITAADTKAPPSAAEEPIKVRIPRLQPSPGQPATSSGPAASDSQCAHPQGFRLQSVSYQNAPKHEPRTVTLECATCGVSWWFDETPVRGAAWMQSISAKPDSTQFAQAWTFAPSGSPLTRGKAVSG